MGQLIGVTKGYLSVMMRDQVPISKKIIDGITISFPGINLNWLLTGEGDMLKGREGAPEDTPAAPLVEEPEAGYDSKWREGILEGVLRRVAELEAEMGVLRAALAALEEKVAALRAGGGGKE